jgi:hypothetical protein
MTEHREVIQIVSPADGEEIADFLTVALCWQYPMRSERVVGGIPYPYFNYPQVVLRVSANPDLSQPLVDLVLRDNQTAYRMALLPQTTYYWQVTPVDEEGERPECAARARFTTGRPRLDATDDDATRYRNPREGAHWLHEKPVPFARHEPLSPWYDTKSYRTSHLPAFDEVKDKLPVPVYDGHQDVLETYWYCWKTLLHHWYFAPDAPNHHAVANLCGTKPWGPWGSTMVWDTAFILYFARYGHQAYPFITAFDNCYARQHENGFICRESDKDNHEVYVWFPVNPPLFAWAEWHYYRISGDKERLARVFLPIVKHYEWWMTYQRRTNGVYWTDTFQEADDSPRNPLVHDAVSATSYQALAAVCLSQMAAEIGRTDMCGFFSEEYARLGELVNQWFWDEEHRLYNDLNAAHEFITEPRPGVFCKHGHMFWPLIAGIATGERALDLVRELMDPTSFNRRNGVPSLSADSDGYLGGPDGAGSYWKGSVWPPIQCMVAEGLKRYGQREALLDPGRPVPERHGRGVRERGHHQGVSGSGPPDRTRSRGVRRLGRGRSRRFSARVRPGFRIRRPGSQGRVADHQAGEARHTELPARRFHHRSRLCRARIDGRAAPDHGCQRRGIRSPRRGRRQDGRKADRQRREPVCGASWRTEPARVTAREGQ